MFSGMDRGRRNLMTAELQGFADYGEVPQPYDEHVHFLRSFEGETVRLHIPDLVNFSYLQIKQLKRSFYELWPNRIDKPFRYAEAIYLLSHPIPSDRISNKTLAQICAPDIKVSGFLDSFGASLGRDGTLHALLAKASLTQIICTEWFDAFHNTEETKSHCICENRRIIQEQCAKVNF